MTTFFRILVFTCLPFRINSYLFAGIDLGTSGCRITVIDESKRQVHESSVSWGDTQSPDEWMNAITNLLKEGPKNIDGICVSGTSATCLLVDEKRGRPTTQPLMYNYNVVTQDSDSDCGVRAMEHLKRTPSDNPAFSPTSSWAKVLYWHYQGKLKGRRICHQADYCSLLLRKHSPACGRTETLDIVSDWHNCLKLGYDVRNLEFPGWIVDDTDIAESILPNKVVSPGTVVGDLDKYFTKEWGWTNTPKIMAGTTDANAAFLATDSNTIGTAVTSLGSTLALKQLSSKFVQDASRGVYSHRFPSVLSGDTEAWLAGGASNVGCAILRQENFEKEELVSLSKQIDPVIDSGLEYYPLCRAGERFPVSDGNKQPQLKPEPPSRARYLHGILEGIGRVEVAGYEALVDLGSPPPLQVYTAGGGSVNPTWTKLRQRLLSRVFPHVTVERAPQTEASYGAALLCRAGFLSNE